MIADGYHPMQRSLPKASSKQPVARSDSSVAEASVPQQPRRLACDRCHTQKLRCKLTPDDPDVCERCLRARVQCTWSPRLRIGRPVSTRKNRPRHRDAAKNSLQGKQSNGISFGRSPNSTGGDSEATFSPVSSSEISFLGNDSDGYARHHLGGLLLPSSLGHGTAPFAFSDTIGPTVGAHVNTTNGTSLNSFVHQLEPMSSYDSFQQPPSYFQSPFPDAGIGYPSYQNHSPVNNGIHMQAGGGRRHTNPSYMSYHAPAMGHEHHRGESQPFVNHVDHRFVQSPTPHPPNLQVGRQLPQSQTVTVPFPTHNSFNPAGYPLVHATPLSPGHGGDFSREMADLNYKLQQHLKGLNDHFWRDLFSRPALIGPGYSNLKYPVAEIFNFSKRFVDILSRFGITTIYNGDNPAPFGPSLGMARHQHHYSNPTNSIDSSRDLYSHFLPGYPGLRPFSSSSDSSPKSSPPRDLASEDSTSALQQLSANGSTPPSRPFTPITDHLHAITSIPLDSPLALLTVTGYLRLLRLFNVVFSHLNGFTQSIACAPSMDRSNFSILPPVPPELQAKGVPTQIYGMLQIALIVKVSCHLLSQFEAALGIRPKPQDLPSKATGPCRPGSYPQGNTGSLDFSATNAPFGFGGQVDLSKQSARSVDEHGDRQGILGNILAPDLLSGLIAAEGMGQSDLGNGRTADVLQSLRNSIIAIKRQLRRTSSF